MTPAARRYVLAFAWPLALIVFLYERTAWLGFNVLDEGLIATYGRRLLDGQVPHRDFISPRPIGSSILHLPDFLIPLPEYIGGRLVGITTVVAYSVLIAWLIYGRPPTRWGVARSVGAAAAALVNLHTFDETPWYTFDGLLLSAAALLMLERALRRDSVRLGAAAFLVAGVAVTTKQSFAPAPLALLVWLAWETRRRPAAAQARFAVGATLLAALPMLLYVGVIGAFGGFSDVVEQLTSGRLVWGRALFELVGAVAAPGSGRPGYGGHFPWEVALAAAVVALVRVRAAGPALRAAAALVFSLLVARLCFHGDLLRTGAWSLELMWALILTLVIRVVIERRVDARQLAVLLLAWMSMLSRGYDVPGLVAGSMALAMIAWAWEAALLLEPAQLRWVAPAGMVAALAAFGFTAVREVQARDAEPYFDKPKAELIYSVARFSPEFKGIKTSRPVYQYLNGLQQCRRRYPAHWTAVIPDNAGLYMTMHMHNPFPIDWFFSQDYEGQRGRLVDAARKLERKGDYLVLLQTVSGLFLSQFDRLPDATRGTVPVMLTPTLFYDQALGRSLLATLHGRHVVCGSFLGIWQPRAS